MSLASKSAVVVLAVFGCVLAVHARTALHAAVPKDMPQDSQFLQSNFTVATDEAQGNWIACRLEQAETADWCRVTDQNGMVVFEGEFLPVSSGNPLPTSEIKVTSAARPRNLWIQGPAEGGPVPAIPLVNGDVLVPAADRYPLQQRWAGDPREYNAIVHPE